MHERDLQRIYDDVAADLYTYIARVRGNAAGADDVFQETFTRLLGSGFSGDLASDQRRYVFRIATNLLRDRQRWSQRWQFGKMPDLTGPAPETRYDDKIDVQRALAELKPRQRSLLWLAYVEGLPHKEIAEILGTASTSVRSGSLDNSTRFHLDGCQECREAARVIGELAPLAALSQDIPSFPSVYWRARSQDVLGQSHRRNRHVVSPLRFFHIASGAGLVAAAVAITMGPLVVPTAFGAFGFVALLMALAVAAAGGYQISAGNPRSAIRI